MSRCNFNGGVVFTYVAALGVVIKALVGGKILQVVLLLFMPGCVRTNLSWSIVLPIRP